MYIAYLQTIPALEFEIALPGVNHEIVNNKLRYLFAWFR